jgi:hypothetical protein
MQRPVININGTDPRNLLEDYVEAKRLAVALREKLDGMWPHGRDYQTHYDPRAGFQLATNEHAHRLLSVRTLIVELEMLAESVI